MFCHYCGKEIEKKSSSCPYCGKKVAATKETHHENTAKVGLKYKGIMFCSIFLGAILVVGSVGALVYFDVMNIPVVEDFLQRTGLKEGRSGGSDQDAESVTVDESVEEFDAEQYFQQNSKIIEQMDVNKSKNVLTEAKAIDVLEKRGFTDYPVTTEYTMDGIYSDATTISDSSSTKHPIYKTSYVTEDDDLWTVYVIDGDIMAKPVSYNMQWPFGAQIILSESEAVTSYDSVTNQFYKTIPNESELLVRVVEKINADTLEKFEMGDVDE